MNNNVSKKINRILVPVDFSGYSLNACYFAMHLASRTGAGLKLFHAFFNPMIDAMAFPDAFTYQSNMAEVFRELEENSKKEMKKFAKKLKKYAKLKNLKEVEVETGVVAGQPGEEIESIIEAYDPDFIVIGTRGHGDRANEVLGSVASRVIDISGIPVLLVTRDAKLREKGNIRLLYATDFDDSDYQAIGSLSAIMSGYSLKIFCVHFETGSSKEDKESKMSEMKHKLIENKKVLSIECHNIKSDDIVTDLNLFVEANDIEMIALTHKKRNIFYRLFNPSLAKKLLFETKKPVFVFN
ncbi:MAG: universal stress protein [Marinilabiliales bacterium]|nr:MAG: universal stress protein [Marinilabiliales bacterium]